MAKSTQIFISYRVADTRSTAGRLEENLRQIYGDEAVFLDHRNLDPGEQWPEGLKQKLAGADVVIVLIGKSWLTVQDEDGRRRIGIAEDWVRKEVAAGLSGTGKVLPLLVNDAKPIRAAAIEDLSDIAKLATLQALPLRDVEWESDFAHLVNWLEKQGFKPVTVSAVEDDATAVTPQWRGNPYRGLASFRPEDAPIYYGRERETDELLHQVEAKRVVAVIGASGSGKSSIVAAGLLPNLGKDWLWVRFTPAEAGENPLRALARKLAPKLAGAMTADELAERLHTEPEAIDTLAAEALAGRAAGAQLLLFADQFEELFSGRVAEPYRVSFIDLVSAVAGSEHVRLVLTLRADYTEHCTRYEALMPHLRTGNFLLGPPGVTALQKMIERPAQDAGLEVELALVDRIIEEAGTEPGALALVEFTLEQLYDERHDSTLTLAAYNKLDGVGGAIEVQGEKAIGNVAGKMDDPAMGNVFRALAAVDEHGGAVRKRTQLEDFGNAERSIVDSLVTARLLVTDTDAEGDSTVEVAHEAVLRHWGRFRQWLDANRELELWRQQLETYRRGGAPLSRGLPLKTALDWLKRRPADLDKEEQAYILASRSAARRFHGWIGGGFAAVLITIGAVGSFAVWTTSEGLSTAGGLQAIRLIVGLDKVPLPEMVEIPSQDLMIGAKEVTFDEYDLFVQVTGARGPNDFGWGRGKRPVIDVSWDDAQTYIEWLSNITRKTYRLPTDREWEYAASSGDKEETWAGTSIESELDDYAWYLFNSDGSTQPVGQKFSNDFNLYDMSGNVWEWVQDCFADSCADRVMRGGSWDNIQRDLRSASRFRRGPTFSGNYVGFRLAQDL